MEATRTLYVQNLNEKVVLSELISELQRTFDGFGASVEEVIAKKRLSMRGQAFVVCKTRDTAIRALNLAHGFRLFGRAMLVRFARRNSDIVNKADGTYEQERLRRAQEKLERSKMPPRLTRRQMMEQMSTGTISNPPTPKIISPTTLLSPNIAEPVSSQVSLNPSGKPVIAPQIVGGELQLPNKVLYLQNLPPTATEESITNFFRPNHSVGLVEVRLVPTRRDLAFVEFTDENLASSARSALDGSHLDDVSIKLSFAKR